MVKHILATALLLLTLACHNVDTGNPPSFDQATVKLTPLNESQIQITWEAGYDDFLTPPELNYSIWFAKDGEIDLDGPAQIQSRKGALSWTLTGLETETTYQILVRATDGRLFSDVSETLVPETATTTAAGKGTFDPPVTATLNAAVIDMFVGNGEVGVISATEIEFYKLGTNSDNNTVLEKISAGDLPVADVTQAALAPTESGATNYDLFLITPNSLQYRTFNNGYPDTATASVTDLAPTPGSLGFIYGDTTSTPAITYVYLLDNTTLRFFELNEDKDAFSEKAALPLGADTAQVKVVNLGTDHEYGVVYLIDNVLRYIAGNADFQFGNAEVIDTIETFSIQEKMGDGTIDDIDVTYNSGMTAQLDVFPGGTTDTDLDIHIFWRDATNGVAQMYVYSSDGVGTFSTATIADFDQISYNAFDTNSGSHNPVHFVDWDNDGRPDLLAAQEAANNVGVHLNGTSGLVFNQSTARYYAFSPNNPVVSEDEADELPVDFIGFGGLDTIDGFDLALISGNTISVLTYNPQ